MKLDISYFNGSGKILARAVGVYKAFDLLLKFGGQSFWICKEPKPSHATSIKLGLKAHQALSENWPEQDFELPMATHVQKKIRNEEIVECSAHMSMREMVKKFDLTRSALQMILREYGTPEMRCEKQPAQEQLKLL